MSHARINISVVFDTWDKFVQGRDAFIAQHRASLLAQYMAPRKFLGFTLRPRTEAEAEKLLRSHDVLGYLDTPWHYRGDYTLQAQRQLEGLYSLAMLAKNNGYVGRKFIYVNASDAALINHFNPRRHDEPCPASHLSDLHPDVGRLQPPTPSLR